MVQERNDTPPVAIPAAVRHPLAPAAASNPAQAQAPAYKPTPTPQPVNIPTVVKSDVAYEIKGEGSQFIELKLRPGQYIAGEINALMYYEAGISMKMRLGGGAAELNNVSFFQKLIGMGKSAAKGHKLFMMTFTNTTQKELKISFSMPYTGTIIPVDLSSIGGKILCQNDVFICATSDLQVTTALPKDLGGNFMTSAIPMQKIEGRGTVFLFCGGSLMETNILQGQPMHVATGTTLALQPGIILKTKWIPKVGVTGQGHSLTEISGAGRVWLQSLPHKRAKDSLIGEVGMFFGIKKKKKQGGVMGAIKK